LQAVGDAATGIDVSGAWNSDFDNPVSRRFVDGFTKAYGRLPTMYAAQGYDTAIAIGSALKAVGGNVADTEGFRAAMLKADFKLTRESFKFGRNQHPVQDWYSMKVDRGADGKPVLKTQGKILGDYGDPFAAACKL
jgi:branched-chain amino acid transport system substrate-binding protein